MGVARTAVPHEQLAESASQTRPSRRIVDERKRFGQVSRRGRFSRQRLGFAQLGEHDATPRGLGRLAERPAQQAHGRVGRAVGQGVAGGVAQQRHHGGVSRRLAAHQVRSDARAPRALGREQQARAAVSVGQGRGRDPLVHGPPDERMDEGERRRRRDDLGRDQAVGGAAGPSGVDPGEGRGLTQRRALEHRDGARKVPRVCPQTVQSRHHGAGDRLDPQALDARQVGRRWFDALDLELGDQLPDQERVAGARPGAGGAELRIRVGAQRRPHQCADRLVAQRGRLDQGRPRIGAQGREELLGDRRLTVTHGEDRERAQLLAAPVDVGEKPHRGRISPVAIVNHERDRRGPGDVAGQPVQAVHEREPTVGGLGRIFPRRVGRPGRREARRGRRTGFEQGAGERGRPRQQRGAFLR